MAREARADEVIMDGVVKVALPNAMFTVELDNGHEVLGYLAGKMRMHKIRVLPGDRVQVSVSTYDPTRARIMFRQRT